MSTVVKFVSAVGESDDAHTRLDLTPMDPARDYRRVQYGDGVDFGWPQLSTVVAEGAGGDGDVPVASRYGNRQITLPIVYTDRSTPDQRRAAIGALARELDRDRNVLYVRADGASEGRWLITYRAAGAAADLRTWGPSDAGLAVTLAAEPFAYGPTQTVPLGQVSGNPETGTWIFDVPACLGDVDPPLNLDVYNPSDGSGSGPAQRFILASRTARYDPTGTTYVWSTPVTPAPNVSPGVASVGAAGGTATRWTPPGNGVETFLFDGVPVWHGGGATLDMLGRWRVFARIKRQVSTDVFRVRAKRSQHGGSALLGLTHYPFALPASTGWTYADLGIIDIPPTRAPGPDLYGAPQKATSPPVQIYANRVSGTGVFDIDHMLALPADGHAMEVDLRGGVLTSPGAAVRIDGDRNTITVVQAYDTGGGYVDAVQPPVGWTGSMLRLSPRWPTQLFAVADASNPGVSTATLNLAGTYRPRYLSVV